MTEDTTEIPMDEQARIAFENAAYGRNLCGMPLEKYTRLRKHTAKKMGMVAPFWSQADWEDIRADRLYANALDDLAILFWLLTRNEAEVTRAHSQPHESYLVAIEWAGELGITERDKKLTPAYKLLLAIMNDIAVSAFGVESDGGSSREKKDDASPLV